LAGLALAGSTMLKANLPFTGKIKKNNPVDISLSKGGNTGVRKIQNNELDVQLKI
jgi:hypothetical protein